MNLQSFYLVQTTNNLQSRDLKSQTLILKINEEAMIQEKLFQYHLRLTY
jgi:hypothetical protein